MGSSARMASYTAPFEPVMAQDPAVTVNDMGPSTGVVNDPNPRPVVSPTVDRYPVVVGHPRIEVVDDQAHHPVLVGSDGGRGGDSPTPRRLDHE